jgi:hypothetical protein
MVTSLQFILKIQRKYEGIDTVDIEILRFNKALKNGILYCIYGYVTEVHIGGSSEIWLYRYSGYWEYWRSIRPSKLEYCSVYMSTEIQFILEFQRKYEGTNTVDIENFDVQ